MSAANLVFLSRPAVAWLFVIASAGANVGANLLLKNLHTVGGTDDRLAAYLSIGKLLVLGTAFTFYILAFFSYAIALRGLAPTLGYPVLVGATVVCLGIIGHFTGTPLSLQNALGILAIVGGIFLLVN